MKLEPDRTSTASEPPFRLLEMTRAHQDAQNLFERVRQSIAATLPPGAEVRHIGATAVPGCLTKGDLDVVVRVPGADFAIADRRLAGAFTRNMGSVQTEEFSAFEDASTQPHLGIQLVAIDGEFDFFHLFVEELLKSPALVEEYNALKRRYEGSDMARYRAAKDAFVARVLAGARRGTQMAT